MLFQIILAFALGALIAVSITVAMSLVVKVRRRDDDIDKKYRMK